MDDNDKKFLNAMLSSTLKMDETAVASLLNEDGSVKPDALKIVLEKDATRVAEFTATGKGEFNNGYKKAQGEILGNFEKELKEKLKVSSDKKGLELIDEIIESVKESGKKKEITADDVMRHPAYKELQTRLEGDLKNTKDEFTKKLSEQETAQKKKETLDKVKATAKVQLEAMKPLLSQDPARAANQLEWFYNDLAGYEWELNPKTGKYEPMKDGKAVTNPQGYTISLEEIAKSTGEKYYDFQAADPRGTPPGGQGTPPGAGGTGTKVDLMKPTSRQHYIDQVTAIRSNKVLTDEDKTKHLIELDKLNDDAKKVYEGS